MAQISILVAQTTEDILAQSIAEGIRHRGDVALSFDRVMPIRELFILLNQRDSVCPDVVILIGPGTELSEHANKLLENYPSIVVVRIAIGSEVAHMDLRQLDLNELIVSACGLFRRHGAWLEQRLTAYKVVPDHNAATLGEMGLGLVEVQRHRRTMLDKSLIWLDTVLRLHLERIPNTDNDMPGLSVSRTTIENLLQDASCKPDSEFYDTRCAVESARDDLMRSLEESEPGKDPLVDLCKNFELTPLEIDAFLLCLAPELDAKYQLILGFMHYELGRRNTSLGLIASILGETLPTRMALAKSDTLLRWRLVATPDHSLPHADDLLRVDPTLVSWILGNRLAIVRDPHLAGVVLTEQWVGADWLGDPADLQRTETLLEFLAPGHPRAHWVVLAGNDGSVWRALLEKVTEQLAIPMLRISLGAFDDLDTEAVDARLARLGWAARLMGSIPAVDASGVASQPTTTNVLKRLVDTFAGLKQSCVLIVPDIAQVSDALPSDNYQLLSRNTSATSPPVAAFALATRAAGLELIDADNERLASAYPLSLDRLDQAVRLAVARGATTEQPVEKQAALFAKACRIVACPELPRFATALEPSFELEEVILPPDRHRQLEEIISHVLHARTVLNEWGFNAKLPYGKGVAALFNGPSGTGKTMAARAIGRALDRRVFAIDLARVVSKYIGETEKNLDTVFTEAERAGAILLFDEADALFGKRSEVKDAHDRYANIETAYLLQRMEMFGGLAILTTNFGQNLDRAFLRRLRMVVEFPVPDAAAREKIWRQCLPSQAPLAADIDFRFLSRRVEITGGNIQQITVCAAFAAASEGEPISMRHILQATRTEVLKLGMPGIERELAEVLKPDKTRLEREIAEQAA